MVGKFQNLRTLFITCNNQNFLGALNEMFKVIRSIRLLFIIYYNQKVIPDAIGYLLHLRYLKFCFPDTKLLPRSISSLYHLQFLIFDKSFGNNCYNDWFPRDMSNLCNLRYLSNARLNFPGIGKLKFLQELKGFCIKNENGYRIEELEHMNDLRIVEINDLKDVRGAESNKAKLCDKRKLTTLSLIWDNEMERDNANPDLDESVLDNLQPHNYLKELRIRRYMGSRSPIWMNEANLINNLQKIYLSGCLEWEILPPFGQLPFLKTLNLFCMPKVKRLENKFHGNDMCCVFPSLEELSFVWMDALVHWFDASVADGLFPCLTVLRLLRCPNLQELLYLPPKLETLEMSKIGWKTLNCCTISNSIPLKILDVRDCPNITSIFVTGESTSELEKVTVENLPSLQSLQKPIHYRL